MKKIIIGLLIIIEIVLITLIIVLSLYKKGLLFDAPIPIITNIYIDDNNYVNIDFKIKENGISDKIYFLKSLNSNIPDKNSPDWKLITGNSLKYLLDNSYYGFFKNEDDVVIKIENIERIGKITDIKINKKDIYLAVKGKYKPTLTYDIIGHIDPEPYWYSDNPSIAKVNQDGIITGIKNGKTKIHAKVTNKDVAINVTVTNLIVPRPKKYDKNKKYLSCGRYTKEDNDLLDKILEDRVNDVGYKTRAGVVEVGRFYTLEFPYILEYFNENGRLTGNGIDGEGRYYHKGLYLNESRIDNISKSAAGPNIWGCSIYSRPVHRYLPNGLDCSGFISWMIYNGGFDVKDIGAGLTSNKLDLTDYGKRKKLTKKLEQSGKIKVGDLLSSGGTVGGHIAIIIGKDDKNYYVAESLWTDPNVGVRVYSKERFVNHFYYIMLMDDYYKEDGILTDMWY